MNCDLFISYSWRDNERACRCTHSARRFVANLDFVGCQIEPMSDWTDPLLEFTAEKIESLSVREHRRWMKAKLRDRRKLDAKKDSVARTHPCLVPYAELSQSEKEKDRDAVRSIPKFLATVGFRVYRMERKPQTNATP
jgi:hypothetical protein